MRFHDLPGEGLPIIFLHGLGCTSSMDYPDVACQPELAGHRAILLDLLGSGYSDKPARADYSVSGHARRVRKLIRHLELDHVGLYGHSAGGSIALEVAHALPDAVDVVVLGEGHLDAKGGAFSTRFAGMADTADDPRLPQEFSKYLASLRQVENDGRYAAAVASTLPQAAWGLSRSLIEGSALSWRDILYSLPCPVTCLFGGHTTDAEKAELLSHHVPVDTVPDAGHSMAWENPHGLAQAIARAIARVGN